MLVKKICILGLDDYPMLSGARGIIGGENVQHVLLARAWRDLGLDVSLVVFEQGLPRDLDVDGIKVIQAFRPNAGVPGLRFFHPRISRTLWALHRADADVYYQSPASPFTGIVAGFARHRNKLSVVRIASDVGCMPGRQLMRLQRDRKLYDYGLRNASLVVAQTLHQQALLKQHYGVTSEVVNMAVEPPARAVAASQDIDVLWVANFRPVKRPEFVIELARRLPHRNFVMVGGPLTGQEESYEIARKAAANVPNLKLLGPLPYAEAGAVFERARLHLNTSEFEGFPNTFLQAWIRSVPVVTFFDPDGLVRKKQLGCVATSIEEMSAALDALLGDESRRKEMGARARAFASAEFLPRQVAGRCVELIESRLSAGLVHAPATDG